MNVFDNIYINNMFENCGDFVEFCGFPGSGRSRTALRISTKISADYPVLHITCKQMVDMVGLLSMLSCHHSESISGTQLPKNFMLFNCTDISEVLAIVYSFINSDIKPYLVVIDDLSFIFDAVKKSGKEENLFELFNFLKILGSKILIISDLKSKFAENFYFSEILPNFLLKIFDSKFLFSAKIENSEKIFEIRKFFPEVLSFRGKIEEFQ